MGKFRKVLAFTPQSKITLTLLISNAQKVIGIVTLAGSGQQAST